MSFLDQLFDGFWRTSDPIFRVFLNEELAQSETMELLKNLDFPFDKLAFSGFEDLKIRFKSIKTRDRKHITIFIRFFTDFLSILASILKPERRPAGGAPEQAG